MISNELKVVAIVGAGTMGRGIAQLMAQHGHEVLLNDISQELVDRGLSEMKKGWLKAVEKGALSEQAFGEAVSRVKTTIDLKSLAMEADLIIEAIPEKMELKKGLFSLLGESSKEEAILASNTSTLSITEMASVTSRPDKFIGIHFSNPVLLMKLVELVRGLLTSDETVALIQELVVSLDKEPIIALDSPGFATSRLGVALFMEASRVLENGVASVQDIDKAMRLGYGHKMGPFETCDLVGLDARLNNIEALYNATRDPSWAPPQLLRKLVAAGYLGKKYGSRGGYYTFFGIDRRS